MGQVTDRFNDLQFRHLTRQQTKGLTAVARYCGPGGPQHKTLVNVLYRLGATQEYICNPLIHLLCWPIAIGLQQDLCPLNRLIRSAELPDLFAVYPSCLFRQTGNVLLLCEHPPWFQ